MKKLNELDIEPEIRKYISKISFDNIEGSTYKSSIKIENPTTMKVTIEFGLKTEVSVDDWQLNIYPAFMPGFHWAPHLTPTDNHIIAQHCFRSPALIVADGARSLAVIPDLDLLSNAGGVEWYLDLDAGKNRLTLGISRSEVNEHVLYVRKPGMNYPEGTLKTGFYIMVSEDGEDLFNPWRRILSFLWDNWGGKLYKTGQPLNGPLDCYIKHTYDWAFGKWKESVWQEFELNGRKVGAPAFIVNTTQSPNCKDGVNEREIRSIWNQAWFSSLRSAQGLYRYAKNTGNTDLLHKALLTKELVLSAPQKNGFFPAVIATEMENVIINGRQFNRSKGWSTYYWGNSSRNPFSRDLKAAPYHIADMSWTALLMLNWYEELEQDERLKEYAVKYADSLVDLQDREGFFPAWLDCVTLKPMGVLDGSPETSISVTFLLKAFELIGDVKYRKSALKAMEAVIQNIIFDGRWEDFETYWSCSSYGNKNHVGKRIKRNNMYKQCNFSMYWTAEALYNCYKTTPDEKYLRLGQRCLDEMLMAQASWQPPYIYVNSLGGFGVMNCDGEWNDARQSLFAELIINYGIKLNMTEYIQRGLAALRAAFVMMYCPENAGIKEQWEKRWPFFNESDYGFMMENYGHNGATSKDGLGIGEFAIYDWGNGSAAEAYLRIVSHFGVDFVLDN